MRTVWLGGRVIDKGALDGAVREEGLCEDTGDGSISCGGEGEDRGDGESQCKEKRAHHVCRFGLAEVGISNYL